MGCALVLFAACATDDAPAIATSGASTSPGETTEDGATDPSAGTTSGSPTTDAATTLASTTDSQTSTSESSPATGEPMPTGLPCDLMTIDPLADPAAVIDAGDGPGQIPTVIGDALIRNCGCHYTDNVVGYTDYASDVTPMSTYADFHAPFWGAFLNYLHGEPIYLAVEQRVSFAFPLPMPSIECSVEGESGTITAVDRALFVRWFAAGAPDGANFP